MLQKSARQVRRWHLSHFELEVKLQAAMVTIRCLVKLEPEFKFLSKRN
jgi:hypothetical protein